MTPEHRALIDQTLQESAQQAKSIAEQSGLSVNELPNIEQLRQSWLGERLEQLAEVAEQGLLYIGKLQARTLLDEILNMLFTGLSDRNDAIGHMIDQARARLLDTQDVVNITEAARSTGLSRTLIYLMIKAQLFHPIEQNGRMMIERRELERIEDYKKEEGSRSSSKGG